VTAAPLKAYRVRLESPVADSFRCTCAANALDIDQKKKSVHQLDVRADIESPFNVGAIVGASGSGKSTLARSIYGADALSTRLDPARPIIDQLPKEWTYDQCAAALSGVGLTSVPCWIRPAHTLSTGQAARAEAALQMAHLVDGVTVIDEWTSVVDRTVAKVMSHCVQKFARSANKQVVLICCHYDVLDWLNPDWVIDCNKQAFTDRRELRRGFERAERLRFDIRRVDRRTWAYFSKYHYLTDSLPGGSIECFGVFHGRDQVGFQCFAHYVPHRRGTVRRKQMHSNRIVIHPDYAGLGLGIRVVNATSWLMAQRGFDVRIKYSSVPVHLAMRKYRCWELLDVSRATHQIFGAKMERRTGFRLDVKTYSYRFRPQAYDPVADGATLQ
jgi:ABC-type dipeptide/oligopeptide/nickel transport system ATPase subunit